MSGNSNILSALSVAGGVNDIGSLRNIEIKRNNETIEVVDIYKTLIYGESGFKTRLRSGDVILVNPIQKLVRIEGGVNVPHLYELKKNESFQDLVDHAQGYSYLSSKEKIFISSFSNKNIREISDINDLNKIIPNSLDSIYIPFLEKESVKITGEIKRPGEYQITKNKTLSSLIIDAGGYTNVAYPFGGLLFRDRIKDQEEDMLKRMYTDLIEFIASSGQAGGSPGSNSINLSYILEELKQIEPLGRYFTEFDLTKISTDSELDSYLEDGDTIHIPKFEPIVFVYGEVMVPGSQRYEPGRKIDFYINKSGGLSRFADNGYIYVISPDGTAQRFTRNLLSNKDLLIYPGSTIYVSRQVGKIEGVAYAALVAPIFSSLALSLASLNSINN